MIIVLKPDSTEAQIDHVLDRIRELGFKPRETFETGLEKTVRWYLDNSAWIQEVKSGDYRKWIEQNYGAR